MKKILLNSNIYKNIQNIALDHHEVIEQEDGSLVLKTPTLTETTQSRKITGFLYPDEWGYTKGYVYELRKEIEDLNPDFSIIVSNLNVDLKARNDEILTLKSKLKKAEEILIAATTLEIGNPIKLMANDYIKDLK